METKRSTESRRNLNLPETTTTSLSYTVPKSNAALEKSDEALKLFLQKNSLRSDPKVDEIYLGHNDLTEIRSLERFRKLTKLWLQSNKLQRLPFIQRCYSLSELYLQENLLQTIDNCLRQLTNISVLFLHGNQLSNLESVAHELSYLKALNNLSNLDKDININDAKRNIYYIHSYIDLFDNPIASEKHYQSLVLHKIPSLVILDRNTITQRQRFKAFTTYEPERTAVNERHVFMRGLRFNEYALGYAPQNKPRSESNKSQRLRQSNEDDQNKSLMRNAKHFGLSVKEFSYFDWSKITLFENQYLENEKDSGESVSVPPQRQQGDDETRLRVGSKELPQVVAIRFQ